MLNQLRLQIASPEYEIPPKWYSTGCVKILGFLIGTILFKGESMLESPKTPIKTHL